MKTFVIGSKKLSVDILHAILGEGHEVLGVMTRDEEPGMRQWHEILGHPSLKQVAELLEIPVYEGMSVNDQACRDLLMNLRPDVIFSCFWSEIFKEATLKIPRLGVYNFHTAYLPKNRGSRPIPWAMIRGEAYTGLTIHRMTPGIDDGPIVAQVKVPITDVDTGKSLYDQVTKEGAALFRKILPQFESLVQNLQPQKEDEATYHPRGEPFGGQIHRAWSEAEKDRFRRAFHFPPFRGHREAPGWMHPNGPRVYLVADPNLPRTTLPSASSCIENSIGSPIIRKGIRQYLAPLKPFQPGCAGGALDMDVNGLFGMYSVCDILHLMGISFVSSQKVLPSDSEFVAPFRYENGLLEIPAFHDLHASEDRRSLIERALMERDLNRVDVFIALLYQNPEDVLLYVKEFEIAGAVQVTFTEVCQHYNTTYEAISS